MTGTVDRAQRTFESVSSNAHAARQFVADLLVQHGATAAEVTDLVLVVSELVSNVLEHGNGSAFGVAVNVDDPDWLEVEVTSSTAEVEPWMLDPDRWTVAGAGQVSGRGLGIVRRLMDEVVTDATSDRLTVRCRRRRTPAVQPGA